MRKEKGIGIEVNLPSKKCNDKHCPFHGELKLRGRLFEGKIISNDFHKTVKVEWPRLYYLKKYERYGKRRSEIKVHNPECISAKKGDKVRIMECRPISKTKNFVVIERIKNETS